MINITNKMLPIIFSFQILAVLYLIIIVDTGFNTEIFIAVLSLIAYSGDLQMFWVFWLQIIIVNRQISE